MSLLLSFPPELLHQIAYQVDDGRDLKALARVSHRFYVIVTEHIFRPTRSDVHLRWKALMWACASGSPEAVQRLHFASSSITNVDIEIGKPEPLHRMTPSVYLSIPACPVPWPNFHSTPHMHCPGYWAHGTRSCNTRVFKPLHMAAHHGQHQVVEALLQLGADPNGAASNYIDSDWPLTSIRHNKEGSYTPLHVALCRSQEEIAKSLVSSGASIYVYTDRYEMRSGPGPNRLTAFHICAANGLIATARYLIEQGYAEAIDTLDEFGFSPMMYAYRFRQDDFLAFLISRGVSMRVTPTSVGEWRWADNPSFDADSSSILHQACLEGRWSTVAQLINLGADPFETDRQGREPLLLCTIFAAALTGRGYHWDWRRWCSYRLSTRQKLIEVREVISAVKSCGLHRQVQRHSLIDAMSHALTYVMMPFVTFLVDCGFDLSTPVGYRKILLQREKKTWEEPSFPTMHPESRSFDPKSYYIDTGRYSMQLTVLDHTCFHAKENRALAPRELVKFLIGRGCLAPGDIDVHVRALKNLAAGGWYDDYRREEVQHCARLICSHLSATLPGGEDEKPRVPADLVYICFDRCLDVMVEELAKTFDFARTGYSDTELRHLFECFTATKYDDLEFNYTSLCDRQKCLKFLYQIDGNNYILQHDDSFEALCRAYLPHEKCEGALLDFIDRGGKYCFNFSDGRSALFTACDHRRLQLAKKLLDLGADPNQHVTSDEDCKNNEPACLWTKWEYNHEKLAVLRLLLERGANPFRADGENPGLGFPFKTFIEANEQKAYDYVYPELFSHLCQFSINSATEHGDLYDVLEVACAVGRYNCIQEMRATSAKTLIDAVLRDNAAVFLQKLLFNLSPMSGIAGSDSDYDTIRLVDQAIDTMSLLLSLGPAGILMSSWRLQRDQDQDQNEAPNNAFELIESLLTAPVDPHLQATPCTAAIKRQYKLHWCLEKRIKTSKGRDGTPHISILEGPIDWPDSWDIQPESCFYVSVKRWVLDWIYSPWGCDCEPPFEPDS
ncbi:nacht and ankyrin domain protein [Apiospora arundinis]|uniref:Nacht and ankyrin domain protein n=1 Tax=Apiospora arundinis TaxID=335852 RepID=A0ABR2JP45_9PEZI